MESTDGSTMSPLKIYALVPSEREQVCDHKLGFSYTGDVPCTGPRRCAMCGTDERDVFI